MHSLLFGPNGIDPTTLTAQSFLELMLVVARLALALIGAIALIYILVAALQYILALGNAGKQTEAKNTIVAALIGFAIVVASFTITNTVLHRLQFNDTIIKGNPESSPIQDVIKGK